MGTYETAAYCAGYLGPGSIQTYLPDIQRSGLTTAILWAVHVGQPSDPGQHYGDLDFNDADNLFISQGVFNPLNSSAVAAWPQQVAQLKQGSSVGRIFFSIGGGGVGDFTNIQHMLQNGMTDVLEENFAALKKAFTVGGACVVDGFDLDCEEGVDESTIVSFSHILFDLGFEVTFCPYGNPSWWQSCMQALWNQGLTVSWWNLQCYAGGNGNGTGLTSWIDSLAAVVGKADAASHLMPGLAVKGSESDGKCPTGSGSIEATFAGWSGLGLRGGFLWTYDDIVKNGGKDLCPGAADLAAYASAITDGLHAASPAAAPSKAPEIA
jgi:hypothetical protein